MSNLNKGASTPAPAPKPGPAPSPVLLSEFAKHADRLRVEAGDCKVTASAAAEAAEKAQATATGFDKQLRELMEQVDRVRAAFDEYQAKADEHRQRADEHAARAAELLNDAAYLDETVARAPHRFPVLGPQCSCTLPGAPDAAARAAACPVHSTPAAKNGAEVAK